ncbi:MAG: flagellar basal body P-ring formation protein FlgA [Zoogloeaceae bacterium]|jgi:flagella basal body P-ring formation protein FlgA|nr:flagellar basal body P-ring formation protein FlgA [Zoogloeaceae bacterium]
MKKRLSLLCVLLTLVPCAFAAHPALEAVENYVRAELGGQPGFVGVQAGPLDPRLRLPACVRFEVFAPTGVRLVGNVNLGVRCLDPTRWSLYVPTRIRIERDYAVAATALPAGHRLEVQDLHFVRGDLGQIPASAITEAEAAIGKTLKNALAAGQTLRREALTEPQVIQRGQRVRLVYQGTGFSATNEGQALNPASLGQPVQVRTQSGAVVGGIAAEDGTVRVGGSP